MTAVITGSASDLERARAVAATVTDPELPMLTLDDLGVLRSIEQDPNGVIVVAITPTYSGCPAMAAMRADLHRALSAEGFDSVEVRTTLTPPWSSDWISQSGRRKLSEHGIAPPGRAPRHRRGPVPLTLVPPTTVVRCPRCHSADTEQTSQFGSTACKALHRCRSCGEPFDRIKEI